MTRLPRSDRDFKLRQSASVVSRVARGTIVLLVLLLAFPALLLATHWQPEPEAGSLTLSRMPVSFICMGCNEGNRLHFTDYKGASCHYARSASCNRSNRGIATIVLPNRATDQDAGGSGGAGPAWTGQQPPRPRQGHCEFALSCHYDTNSYMSSQH